MKKLSTKNLVLIAMFAAISVVLMLFRFPILFIAPSFYKLDLSEVPVLIGTFAMGPLAGMIIEFLKILLNLLINGTDTAYIGEISNFVIGLSFVLPAGFLYDAKKTKKRAHIALGVGTVAMVILGSLMNGLVLLPWYAENFFASAGGMDAILKVGAAVHPSIGTLWGFVLLCVAPFNLAKGLLVSLITALIYKRISFLIKDH